MAGLPEYSTPEILVAPGQSAEATAVYGDWSDLLGRIRSGETEGAGELHRLFGVGIRSYLVRQVGTRTIEDRVQDILADVVLSIRRGELREPEHLMGFVLTIVRRYVGAHIHQVIHDPQDSATTGVSEKPPENPKEALAFRERIELMARVLRELPVRDREVLTRIYLYEQSPDQVCSEMSLTETQFRLLISRVKARFGRLARARLIKESDIELGTNRNATPELSRIVPVIAHAVAVFGDEHKASHWLVTRLPLLGDRSPSQVLEEPEGIKLVEQILTRIEHNIPS